MSAAPSTRTIARLFFTLVALAVLLYLLYLVRSVIGLVCIAIFLAVSLGPAVDVVGRGKVPRGVAIIAVYAALFAVIFVVGLLVVPPVVDQVRGLADDIPEYIDELRQNATIREFDDKYDITEKLTAQAEQLPNRLADAASALRAVTVGVFTAALQLVTVLTITFFLLLDGGKVAAWLLAQLPPERRTRYRRIAEDVYKSTGGYVGGVLTIALLSGISTYVVLTILGVPFSVPLSVLMAFFSLIPLVGATIAGVVVALVTVFNDFPTDTIVWVVFLVVYQQVENSVLGPIVYKRTVDLHPLLVIVAILVGSGLLGVLGALVAIPIAAAIQILARDWWQFREEARRGTPLPPEAPPPDAAARPVAVPEAPP